MAEQILIEFIASTEGLAPAIDQLEALGQVDKATAAAFKATNAELAKRTAAVKATATATQQSAAGTKKSIQDVDTAVRQLTQDFVEGFQEGVNEALKEAGVSAEEFAEALKNGGTEVEQATTSIRGRLREIVQELALMRSRGEEATNPERYAELTREAGNLRDALVDVNEEIDRAGSDTGAFDSLIQVAQGVAGGFAVAQGAAALFGDESEELQEVLLRVNATMAILQGFQQLQATWAARIAVARGLETAATSVQTAALSVYNFVVGTSIGLMRAFRIALAATGVGLFIIAIVELVSWLNQTAEEMETVNRELERNKNIVEADTSAIKGLTEEYIAFAESRNALESDLIRLRGQGLQQERQVLAESNTRLAAQRDQVEENTEAWFLLNKQIDDNNTAIRALDRQTIRAAIDLEKALAKERLESQIATTERILLNVAEGSRQQLEIQQKLVRDKLALDLATQALTEQQRLQIIEAANREQLELRLAFQRREIQTQIAGIEERLRYAEQGSIQEFAIRQELVRRRAALELATTKLSAAERRQVEETAANEVYQLELDIATRRRDIAVELRTFLQEQSRAIQQEIVNDAVNRNQRELALLQEGTQERLVAELAAVELQATQERIAAGNNALEIERINAESERRKFEVRIQYLQRAQDIEMRLLQANNSIIAGNAQRTLNSERSTFAQRIDAMMALTDVQLSENQKQQQATKELYYKGAISADEYNARIKKLKADEVNIQKDGEQKILEATRERTRAQIRLGLEVAQQLVGVLDTIFQQQADREQSRIEEQRTRVDELVESGAITEKEADRRRKQLEVEERKSQQRAAQRSKQLAIFNILLSTAQAIATALATPPAPNFVLAAIAAALGGAQLAVAVSQPIPKFGKGKKDSYQGLGEVGETGTELIESNGQMFVAPKRTIVWLGAKDKVYNPRETAAMLEKPGLRAARIPEGMGVQVGAAASIDYEKFGAAVAKHQRSLSLNIDGYKNFVINGHSFDTYLNRRRGY